MVNFFKSSSKEEKRSFEWNRIEEMATLSTIKKQSNISKIVIFKHSTTCRISNSVFNKTVNYLVKNNVDASKFYLLDLLKFRAISNQIADDFKIKHESPQILIIEKENCIDTASHYDIVEADFLEKLTF